MYRDTRKVKKKTPPPTLSVLFVDQTVGGELARRLQQVEDRLAREMMGVVGKAWGVQGENLQDVKAAKIESYMLKHVETDHLDGKGLPKIGIIRTCQDALSRQVEESVRIDLIVGNVLNCRV